MFYAQYHNTVVSVHIHRCLCFGFSSKFIPHLVRPAKLNCNVGYWVNVVPSAEVDVTVGRPYF